MTEPYEIELGEYTVDGYVVNDYFPASRGLISNLNWTYVRPGGCGELEFTLQVPYDMFGVDYRSQRSIRHLSDVTLRLDGQVWWRGYIRKMSRKIAFPESMVVRAVGYSRKLEDANSVTWRLSQYSILETGEIGGIPGIIRGFLNLLPLLLGTDSGLPHPAADTVVIDGTPNIPKSFMFDSVTLYEAFSELATLAGNYDWGIDENRRFYFLRPQTITSGTAMYGMDTWSTNGSGGYYADNTYRNPQSVPPYLEIEPSAVFVIGSNVTTYDSEETTEQSRNVLIINGAPRDTDKPIVRIMVSDAVWIDYWKQILRGTVSTAFFSKEEDLRKWGQNRLQLMGRPQMRGGIQASFHNLIIHPCGACRIINPDTGSEIVERISQVRYSIDPSGTLAVNVEIGYSLPPDVYFADQLRRDSTVQQNAVAESGLQLFVTEKYPWPNDTNLTGTLVTD